MADLILASKNGYYNRVVELLELGLSVTFRDRDNATALYWGACRGHANVCTALIHAGSDINARVKWGSTPLHACSDRGHKECVQTLIALGADLNVQNMRGDTPLHLAGYRGYADIVRILLEARAKTTLLNEKKKTAEQEASGQGHMKVTNILHKFQTDQCIKDKFPSELDSLLSSQSSVSDISDLKDNVSFLWNDLDSSNLSNLLKSDERRSSLDLSYARTTMEPQESEEPNSAVSLDGISNIGQWDEGPELRIKAKQTLSDTIADKRIKRRLSPMDIKHSPPISPEAKQTILDPFPQYMLEKFIKSDQSNLITFPRKSESSNCLDKSVKSASENRESKVLSKQLEQLSHFAENLRIQLKSAKDEISDLENDKFVRESLLMKKDKAIKHLTAKVGSLKHSSEVSEQLETGLAIERSSRIQLQGRCQALEEEVARLKVKQKAASDNNSRSNVSSNQIPASVTDLDATVNSASFTSPCVQNVSHTNILKALKASAEKSVLSDRQVHILNQCYRNELRQLLNSGDVERTDSINKEWILGKDFLLRENDPVNTRDSSSLSFRISHQDKHYTLKMLLGGTKEQIDRTDNISGHFGSEYVTLADLPRHKNVGGIFHLYQGSAEPFLQFLKSPYILPAVGITLFLVLPEYEMSFKDFLTESPKTFQGLTDVICDTFYLLLLYQLICAVDHLLKNKVVHGDITWDNIFLNKQLRPIITDFSSARFINDKESPGAMGRSLETDLDFFNFSWTLGSSLSPENKMDSTTDLQAIGQIFVNICDTFLPHLVVKKTAVLDHSVTQPELSPLSRGVNYIVREVVVRKPLRKPVEILTLIGMLLFGPSTDDRTTIPQFMLFYQSKLLKHLALSKRLFNPEREYSIEESVKQSSLEVEGDLLTSATTQQMWEACRELEEKGLDNS